jgi:xylan 1,4-beta-xylosidase
MQTSSFTMKHIENPVLRGFNPDPCILRVGDDYYIATSTFEWWPGVQIHHSRDMRHWRLLTRPLNRLSQLDLHGVPNSGGIWAPDLTHDGEQFYLVYTNVRHWQNGSCFFDTPNFLVTAKGITGPWSEPVFLNASGFDPSLFHDRTSGAPGEASDPVTRGRKWLVNMCRDYRKGRNPFAGILLQELDLERRVLLGEPKLIFRGTSLGLTEGPHLYKRRWKSEWWYYLVVAEGGTVYEHAVTVARARAIEGPYEVHPENPILSSANEPELALQKAGHASFVKTQSDGWYLAHLCGRPLERAGSVCRHCNLGRETAIQRLVWGDDGWPRLAHGANTPNVSVPAPDLPDHAFELEPGRDDFERTELSVQFQSLRTPLDQNWISLTARPGFLRLYGRESLNSRHYQSLIGRRLQTFKARAETCVEFQPRTFQQMAGLAVIYDTYNWVYLRISRDQLGRTLALITSDNGNYDEPLAEEVSVEDTPRIFLAVEFDNEVFRFQFSRDGASWVPIGPDFPSAKLSDEYCGGLGFTGTFIALCAQDLSGNRLPADFDYFEYREL